jgi:hypothetical protein
VWRVRGQKNDVAGHQALRRAAGHAQPAAAGNHRVKDGTGHGVDGHAPRLVGDELGHHGARDAAEVEHVGALTAATIEMRAGLLSLVGAEILSVYDRDAEAMGAGDTFAGALRAGDRAPALRLADARGGEVALDDLLADGPWCWSSTAGPGAHTAISSSRPSSPRWPTSAPPARRWSPSRRRRPTSR